MSARTVTVVLECERCGRKHSFPVQGCPVRAAQLARELALSYHWSRPMSPLRNHDYVDLCHTCTVAHREFWNGADGTTATD